MSVTHSPVKREQLCIPQHTANMIRFKTPTINIKTQQELKTFENEVFL
jgi:hypothetical protein